jgi:hypothetical protein
MHEISSVVLKWFIKLVTIILMYFHNKQQILAKRKQNILKHTIFNKQYIGLELWWLTSPSYQVWYIVNTLDLHTETLAKNIKMSNFHLPLKCVSWNIYDIKMLKSSMIHRFSVLINIILFFFWPLCWLPSLIKGFGLLFWYLQNLLKIDR